MSRSTANAAILGAFVAACHSTAPTSHPTSYDLGAESTRPRALPGGPPEVAAAPEEGPPPVPLERVAPRLGAPVVLARADGATLAYVADEDGAAIRVIDVDGLGELARLALPGRPAQLAILGDGRLVATLRDRDELAVLAGTGLPGAPLRIAQRLALPAEPIGVAIAPGDRELVVTSGWGHALTVLAVPGEPGRPLAVARTYPLAPEPRGVVVSDDGEHAFVSHAVGQSLERIELGTGAALALRMAGSEELVDDMANVARTREACQGFALVQSIQPAGRIFAPQVLAETGSPDSPSEGYGSSETGMEPEVFDVAVIDEDRGKVLGESLRLRVLPRAGRCALPRAAAASARGSLLVTCLGENAVVELDGASAAPMSVELRRWPVPSGPVGIAIDDARERAIVWSQYARTLTVIGTSQRAPAVRTVVLDGPALPPNLARGRELFAAVADPRISGTGQACESCHPDGRQDALVWSSPNGPRQTPMLAGRLDGTGPYGWNGDAKDVARHLAKTFGRLRGTGLRGEDLDALVAYVTQLRAPAPAAAPAAADLIALGEAIFQSSDAQCASCHGEDGRTPDGMRHDVGSKAAGDQRRELDTPSLSYLAGSAPYYHDGRFATLRELLEQSQGKMGQKRKLSPRELDALEAYLGTR